MTPSSSISKSGYQRKSLSVLMTQSTIYRQHEARLARSNRLKDDPRPPFVRVLSLLPGLHIFVPRYEPNNDQNKIGEVPATSTTTAAAIAATTSLPLSAMFSEETKFIKDDSSASTIISNKSAQHMAFPAVVSTAVSSAMAHAMFGKRQPLVLTTNPFQGIPSTSSSLLFSSPAPTSMFGIHGWFSGGGRGPRPALTTPVPIVMASTATLFGTRVYLEELEVSEANHFFTAAMAGLASGVASILLLSLGGAAVAGRGTMGRTTGLWSSRYMGSHMLGGMVYFGSYDYIKKSMTGNTNNNNNNYNLWNTALAGAVAGSLQAAVVTRLPLVCLRAAPTHALIWCAYESATMNPCPSQATS